MSVKRVLIDCDPGMDDAMAIVMACKSPALKVEAITAVAGNYPIEVTSRNARRMLELLGREDIPVARGMGAPMVRPSPRDPFTHGEDGLCNTNLPEPTLPLMEKHGVDLIIDTVKAYPGEITILALAPLTNIAMAIQKAPEITGMIAEIIAISGAFGLNDYAFLNATGDTPQSEWNVYFDPEAAKLVYESGVKLTCLGLDVATHFDVNIGEDDLDKLAESPNPEAKFWRQAISFVNGRGFESYCTIIDCMAVGYAIDSTLVETMKCRVGVETRDGLTLGMTVTDRRHHHVWEHLPTIDIGKKADYGRFLRLLVDLVLS